MKISFYILGLFLLLTFIGSCNTNGCLENRNSVPYAGFYSSETGGPISIDGVAIYGLGMSEDNLLSKGENAKSNIYLPMRSTQSSTGWIFSYADQGLDSLFNDTIIFYYTSSPRFVSEECGVIYDYHITSFSNTSHLMDSVVVTDSIITNIDTERIKIYFRTESSKDDDWEDNEDNTEGQGDE